MSENRANRSLKPLKWYKSLHTRKGRIESGVFLVEGMRAIDQIISASPEAISEIVTVEVPSGAPGNYPVRQVTESQFRSIATTRTPQGTLAVVRFPAEIERDTLPRYPGKKILLLEDIQDPGNVGTLIRTAAAFGFDGIILTEKCADPLSPKCVQASAGTMMSLWLRRTANYLDLARCLQKSGYVLVATDPRGSEDPGVLSTGSKLVLALGNEASGLSPTICRMADCQVRIPIEEKRSQSLNVATCGAICMYLATQTHG